MSGEVAVLPIFLAYYYYLLKDNELIYIGRRKDLRKKVVTELEDIKDILKQYHYSPLGGHSGINNTLAKISQHYMWNGMKADVTEYVSSKLPVIIMD